MPSAEPIVWSIHTKASPSDVYRLLDTDSGRASFWAESAHEREGVIHFEFINGVRVRARVLDREQPHRWSIDYFGSTATFELSPAEDGGTDVTVTNEGVHPDDRCEVMAGWLNVLFPLKAAVDHDIDLRNHDPTRTWDRRYADQ